MSKPTFTLLSRMLKSSKFLVSEQTFIWKKDKTFLLKSLVNFLKQSVSLYLQFGKFNWFSFSSSVKLLSWFLSRRFTNHRTAGEGGGHLFNSSLPLPPASQTLTHQPGDYYRELTSVHSQQPNSNREPLVSERKLLTTTLRALVNKVN